jgi:hypothetical protein
MGVPAPKPRQVAPVAAEKTPFSDLALEFPRCRDRHESARVKEQA